MFHEARDEWKSEECSECFPAKDGEKVKSSFKEHRQSGSFEHEKPSINFILNFIHKK